MRDALEQSNAAAVAAVQASALMVSEETVSLLSSSARPVGRVCGGPVAVAVDNARPAHRRCRAGYRLGWVPHEGHDRCNEHETW